MLTAAVEGAEWAWADWYHSYAGRVRGYLRSRGAVEPDDLLGDVFVQIARNLAGFVGDEAAFRSWLFIVAHHRLIDERRRSTRRPLILTDEPARLDQPAPTNVADEAVSNISVEQLYDLLADLIIGGLSLDETATALDKNLGAVTQLQRRGLAALRRRIDRSGVTP